MRKSSSKTQSAIWFNLVLIVGATAVFMGCAKNNGFNVTGAGASTVLRQDLPSVDPTTGPIDQPGNDGAPANAPVNLPPNFKPESLVWESASHPERSAWTTALLEIVKKYLPVLEPAQDIQLFCPRYGALSKDQKANVWADLFAATSYYESGFDPRQYSVDVGSQNDRDTWSVGLLQLSVVDQQSYNLPFGYNFEGLQDPIKNLNLGVAIMASQIKKYSKILIGVGSPGLYWATLHPGGKYDSSSAIEAKTKTLSFCRP